jgi:hypothetical protein
MYDYYCRLGSRSEFLDVLDTLDDRRHILEPILGDVQAMTHTINTNARADGRDENSLILDPDSSDVEVPI